MVMMMTVLGLDTTPSKVQVVGTLVSVVSTRGDNLT